jgi:hypothetical protein
MGSGSGFAIWEGDGLFSNHLGGRCKASGGCHNLRGERLEQDRTFGAGHTEHSACFRVMESSSGGKKC